MSPKSALPPHLRDKNHSDWPWVFRYIPRAWTSFKFPPPILLWGNQKNFVPMPPYHGPYAYIFDVPSKERYFDTPQMFPTLAPAPIPDPVKTGKLIAWGVYGTRLASWMPVLPTGFAITWKHGLDMIHFRIGTRVDDVDLYVTFPSIAIIFEKNYYATK